MTEPELRALVQELRRCSEERMSKYTPEWYAATCAVRALEAAAEAVADAEKLSTILLKPYAELPVAIPEMTGREYAIYLIAADACGRNTFVGETLAAWARSHSLPPEAT